MSEERIPSPIRRLLAELSWEGKDINKYRNGGKGYENVLTVECLQALDFLPRKHFLGAVVNGLHGTVNQTKELLFNEIEEASIDLLVGNFYLKPSGGSHSANMGVQPDGLVVTASVYLLLEAKRIRSSSFQPQQLAREYFLVTRDAGDRAPLLLLILGKEPPVRVNKHGRMEIADAIRLHLGAIYEEAEFHPWSLSDLESGVESTICWTTWSEISYITTEQLKGYDSTVQDTVFRSVERLALSLTAAVEWHG